MSNTSCKGGGWQMRAGMIQEPGRNENIVYHNEDADHGMVAIGI